MKNQPLKEVSRSIFERLFSYPWTPFKRTQWVVDRDRLEELEAQAQALRDARSQMIMDTLAVQRVKVTKLKVVSVDTHDLPSRGVVTKMHSSPHQSFNLNLPRPEIHLFEPTRPMEYSE